MAPRYPSVPPIPGDSSFRIDNGRVSFPGLLNEMDRREAAEARSARQIQAPLPPSRIDPGERHVQQQRRGV